MKKADYIALGCIDSAQGRYNPPKGSWQAEAYSQGWETEEDAKATRAAEEKERALGRKGIKSQMRTRTGLITVLSHKAAVSRKRRDAILRKFEHSQRMRSFDKLTRAVNPKYVPVSWNIRREEELY